MSVSVAVVTHKEYPVFFKCTELDGMAGVYGAMELLFEEAK